MMSSRAIWLLCDGDGSIETELVCSLQPVVHSLVVGSLLYENSTYTSFCRELAAPHGSITKRVGCWELINVVPSEVKNEIVLGVDPIYKCGY